METMDRDQLMQELCELYKMEEQLLEMLSGLREVTASQEFQNRFQRNLDIVENHMRAIGRAMGVATLAPLNVACRKSKKVLKEGQKHVEEQVSLLTEWFRHDELCASVEYSS